MAFGHQARGAHYYGQAGGLFGRCGRLLEALGRFLGVEMGRWLGEGGS